MSQSRSGLTKNPKLKINLSDIFDTNMPDNSQLRSAIGQEIIDIIRERTKNQKVDWQGEKLKSPYSKEYADSLEFKAFGKSKSNVNLTLTGDMLGLMDIVDETQNTITIGWDVESERGKAAGHITGAGRLPRRDFFGLTDSDIDRIKQKFGKDVEDLKSSERAEDAQAVADTSFNIGLELIKKAAAAESTRSESITLPLPILANLYGDNDGS